MLILISDKCNRKGREQNATTIRKVESSNTSAVNANCY